MTDDQHGEGTPQGGGRWNPLPQGDYDDGATAFVQLPEGGIDALLSADSPLAAPGHGYVPPPITAAPADGTAGWPVPEGQWPDPNAAQAPSHAADDRFTYEPGATQQWTFEEPAAPAAPGHDVTGQWSIPVAGGDLPDESGEYTTSSLAEQWGGTPPATLPGGAPAPWATPWDAPGHTGSHPSGPAPDPYTPGPGYGPGPSGPGETYPDGHGGGYPDPGQVQDVHEAAAGHVGAGYADAGHVDGGHGGHGGHAEGGHEDVGYFEGGHEGAAGHAGAGHPDAGHAGNGHVGNGAVESVGADGVEADHGDAGHALPDAGHADGGHTGAGSPEAGDDEHGRADGPAHAGHADVTDGDTPGGTGTPGAVATSATPGEPVVPAQRPAGSDATPEADAHGLAEALELPSEAPAGHEQPSDPAPAPAPPAPDAPAPAAHPEATADTPGTEAAPDPAAPHPATDLAAAETPEPPAAADAPGPSEAGRTAEDTPQAETEAEAEEAPEAQEAEAAQDAQEPHEVPGSPEAPGTPEAPGNGQPAPDGAEEAPAAPLPPHDDHPLASYVLRVNGTDRPVTDAWIGESLLYVLRERLGLAGAKDGCSQGECGACNVQVDGRLVASCLVPAVTTAGSEVRTVEGLAVDGQPSDVQRALARCGAVQCGFCVPGMAMTVHDLLEGNPAPTELETRQALCGNLCRCSGYRGVLEAVKEVVAEREASHAGTEADGDEARVPHQAAPGSGGVHPSAFEAPGAFAAPRPPEQYDAPDPYGTTPPGPQDQQHYGQDGGQA
ncbi:2Fe-2S iron-sulfur cluster-binding protein [Streptomyces sp. NPDC038707]|uniref:2Fe-2S iron-sulfur cluster-binding protein n=1 Tax=Streptomyces sp. NPDC038707 TaxID=3154329 RepID=UPI0033DFC562